jgi:hypothetical protein
VRTDVGSWPEDEVLASAIDVGLLG